MANNLEATLKRMDELQIAFIAKLGNKIKELSRLILQLDGSSSAQEPHNQQLLEKIHSLSHTLAGSAGTFKHTTVYHKAKAIENLSNDLLFKQTSAPKNWHRLLLEFIVSLRSDVQVSGRPTVVESFSAFQSEEQQLYQLGESHSSVIVVDDDELLVSLIKEQAKHFQYNVIPLLTTENLEDAIDQYQPAAILMDVVFPDAIHSGIEIINQLKAKNKIHCPVVFMSNRCDVAVRLDALRAGSNAYIVKPIDILELVRVLDRLTQKLAKKKSRILIVDDDPFTTDFYEAALNNNGFICESILNPMDVINKALSFCPDAILLDINMPGCNGFELAEIIRQDDSFSHIPLLFLTSVNTREQEIHAVESGGDDFLDKNTQLSTLIAIIKGHVQRYKELDSVLTRLKRDEVRFRSVTSSSTDAIISTDEKGRIVFWNEGAENIFGFSALETIGQNLDFIIPTEEWEQHAKGFENLLANKTWQQSNKQCIERTAVTKQKNRIEVELTYTEWLCVTEKFYTAIIRDVTDRKLIEQELSNKEAYLNAIVSSSGEAIITMSHDGIIETANPSARHLFGYQFDELLGKNMSILYAPAVEQHHHSPLLEQAAFNTAQMIELTGMHKDGSLLTLEMNISPMMIAGQRKFVGILRDISERKKFIKQLWLAKNGAEAASQAKSEFLSNMSHELRTPLNAILGFTQLLQTDTDYPLSAEQMDSLNHIYQGGVQLLSLIEEILNLANIESGVLDVISEKIAFVPFLNKIIKQMLPQIAEAGLSINDLTDENQIVVEADKTKLRHAIEHLLSNAIKYNQSGGSIQVDVIAVEQKIRLAITDTGKGIPEHLLPQLFEPFARLNANIGVTEGAGIGLALTKKLIEMMNGKVGVTSQVNKGTTFWIELERI